MVRNLILVAVIASGMIATGCNSEPGANDPVMSADEFKQKTDALKNPDEPKGPGASSNMGPSGK
ncbi:MAG TPA: hypothetical protein VK934_07685 [Fimbriimonas sp.]|nr:hypothetical protein [Fimbriimonas sp.]